MRKKGGLTNAAGEHRFVVDIALNPCHEMLDIFGCRHLSRTLVILRVLPQILEPILYKYKSHLGTAVALTHP